MNRRTAFASSIAPLALALLWCEGLEASSAQETIVATTSYTLTGPQSQIVVSWLFEPFGYLDAAVNDQGVSARQALQANAALDVLNWIRTNTKGVGTGQSDWNECAMVWWISKNGGVNITPAKKPAEAAAWAATLTAWGASIDDAFSRVSQAIRDTGAVTLTAPDGATSTMAAGSFLVQQRNLVNNVVPVLS